jgi:hypothetical protein
MVIGACRLGMLSSTTIAVISLVIDAIGTTALAFFSYSNSPRVLGDDQCRARMHRQTFPAPARNRVAGDERASDSSSEPHASSHRLSPAGRTC